MFATSSSSSPIQLPATVVMPRHTASGPCPPTRSGLISDVLHKVGGCYHIYGVCRSDILHKIAWRKNYFGHDKVILAEMALMGRFHQIDETLFFKRARPRQSVDNGTRERVTLVNPDVWLSGASQKRHLGPAARCGSTTQTLFLGLSPSRRLVFKRSYTKLFFRPSTSKSSRKLKK